MIVVAYLERLECDRNMLTGEVALIDNGMGL
jgi:hypothetical protein